MLPVIRPIVGERLGFYVYLYVDPRDDRPFYVGKGHGDRALAHLADSTESCKVQRIAEIRAAGHEPRIDILVHDLPSDETAFRIEAAVIDALGLEQLTNEIRGWETGKLGRMPLSELASLYGAAPVEVVQPSILIRVNRLYRYGMTSEELYEITRGVWRVGPKRLRARYAMPVFHGVVREVYEIQSWHAAGTTFYKSRTHERLQRPGRWEFIGQPAGEAIRAQYVGFSVQQHHFKRGLQSPVIYVACG